MMAALAGCRIAGDPPPDAVSIGAIVQADAHPPSVWRQLTLIEQDEFEKGYAVFNTEWVPTGSPPGRIDGLGPVFNVQSCDACHNSRRRGRGPQGPGEVPPDLVMQLGRQQHGTLTRGNADYGYVLNPSAIEGFRPEGRISVAYRPLYRALDDGSIVELREPRYLVTDLSGPPLSARVVVMPRLPPPVQGAGLLEMVPLRELERIAALHLLHDGRARTLEEAILWHDAEARDARGRYSRLSRDERLALLEWLRGL
jgi:CxxC motif-containing protein (DUF1111 family)